jgi:hypothetical protein
MTNQKISNSASKEQEIWKNIEGYDGWYQVSNMGRVRSWKHKGVLKQKMKNPRILSPGRLSSGYRQVGITDIDGKRKSKYISRLVASAFISNIDNKPQVNHIDGNKDNNRASNLEWVTDKENKHHANNTGLMKNKGEDNQYSKLTEEDVLEIRSAYKLGCFTQKEIGNAYNVKQAIVSKILNRKLWKHI